MARKSILQVTEVVAERAVTCRKTVHSYAANGLNIGSYSDVSATVKRLGTPSHTSAMHIEHGATFSNV